MGVGPQPQSPRSRGIQVVPTGPESKRRRIRPSTLVKSRELRHPLTPPERILWCRLRDHQLGYHIRRQHILLERYIADFNCADARLCIEVDGDSHAEAEQAEYDQTRAADLEAEGYQVIRFANREILRDLDAVLEAIAEACRTRSSSERPPPPP